MKFLHLFIPVIAISLWSCSREEVKQYAPTESYPNDNILASIESKRGMIIVAHDDDMCAMAGTMSLLKKRGWDIQSLSIPKNESRDEAHRKACKDILNSVTFFNFSQEEFRWDSAEVKYDAIPKEKFDEVFHTELVRSRMIERINNYNPSVIFTLDNEIGGYGHPEHVFISQMVLDLAESRQITPRYIYQSVFTDHMENTIMERHSTRMKSWGFPGDGWEKAKEAYQVSGMPEPTTQFHIQSEAEAKMNYLMSYNERERKTISFFIPAFQDYTAEEYFSIFDREFFRVIELN